MPISLALHIPMQAAGITPTKSASVRLARKATQADIKAGNVAYHKACRARD
jgi:hypothetical protein